MCSSRLTVVYICMFIMYMSNISDISYVLFETFCVYLKILSLIIPLSLKSKMAVCLIHEKDSQFAILWILNVNEFIKLTSAWCAIILIAPLKYVFIFKICIYLYHSVIALQCCVNFCCTMEWITYYIYICTYPLTLESPYLPSLWMNYWVEMRGIGRSYLNVYWKEVKLYFMR